MQRDSVVLRVHLFVMPLTRVPPWNAVSDENVMTRSCDNQFVRARPPSGSNSILLLTFLLVLVAWPWRVARASDTPKSERELITQLLQQVQELQARTREIDELRARVAELESKQKALTEPLSNPAVAPSLELEPPHPTAVAVPVPTSAANESAQIDNAGPKGVQLHVFGDVGYRATDQKNVSNTFAIGPFDLFMTGSLSDRASILAEVLFTPLHDNSIGLDIERLLLQYKHNDYFSFAVGRYHTSIGYYNTAFHQGEWFQTAIGRPFMYAFDDEGGFLPLQEVGITTAGQIPSGKLGLHYVAELGNGRAHLLGSDPAQNRHDENNGKSFNLAVFARSGWMPGLQVGFSIYHDRLTFSDHLNHPELITAAHLVYVDSNWEFLNEAMLVRHKFSSTGAVGTFHTTGFYSQISRKFGKYRPYFRYSFLNAGVADPIYGDPADGPVVGRRNGPTFGLRFDFNDHAAFKLQYDRLDQRGQRAFNILSTQFSFAF
jgi:hypothetical protein